MSLVGPRPWPPSMVATQVANGLTYRNEFVAGWTGPAQVQKGVTEPAGYAELDLAYVAACRRGPSSRIVRRDLQLLWRTLVRDGERGGPFVLGSRCGLWTIQMSSLGQRCVGEGGGVLRSAGAHRRRFSEPDREPMTLISWSPWLVGPKPPSAPSSPWSILCWPSRSGHDSRCPHHVRTSVTS